MVRLNSFKLARLRAGLTQYALAKRMNCSESLIAKWETGRSKPDPEKLKKLVEILNCEPEELLGDSRDREVV